VRVLVVLAIVASVLVGEAASAQAANPPIRLTTSERADAIAEVASSVSRIEDRSFYSPILARTMPYFVFVPPGYDTSKMRYPVLYMLHGMGGSNTEWKGYNFLGTADEMIHDGLIPPMLIVLPQGDQSYWVDHPGGPLWGQYTAGDVVQEIDKSWRTLADRDHRAIGGLSMGAHGALQLGMRYPDVFGAVGAHSPSLRDFDQTTDWLGSEFFGDETYFDQHDPVRLIEAHPDVARRLKIWIDVGEEDSSWLATDTGFDELLDDLNVPHEFHVLYGGHNGDDYWGPHGADYLRFYAMFLGKPA
jgi:enterochelin esterase-like enzyme